jgi:hypothetical protein
LKQLKQLVLFISCLFLTQLVQQERQRSIASAHETLTTASGVLHSAASLVFKEKHQCFHYRTKALNDFHDHALLVAGTGHKSDFIFVRTPLKGYTQSFLSVSIRLNNWRGPPIA